MDSTREEDRVRAGMQADLLLELLSKRYGLEPNEVIEAVRWVQQHQEFVSKLKSGGMVGLTGLLVTGLAMALWEGFKALLWIIR